MTTPHAHEGHSHGSGAHSHGGGSQWGLAIAFVLNTAFLVVEAVGGLLTGSLALLADAGHMLSDSASLGLAFFAARVAAKPPTPNKSFGYKRAEILAALVNGVTLVAISIWIFYEAYHRFHFDKLDHVPHVCEVRCMASVAEVKYTTSLPLM